MDQLGGAGILPAHDIELVLLQYRRLASGRPIANKTTVCGRYEWVGFSGLHDIAKELNSAARRDDYFILSKSCRALYGLKPSRLIAVQDGQGAGRDPG